MLFERFKCPCMKSATVMPENISLPLWYAEKLAVEMERGSMSSYDFCEWRGTEMPISCFLRGQGFEIFAYLN